MLYIQVLGSNLGPQAPKYHEICGFGQFFQAGINVMTLFQAIYSELLSH
jgi:hypothetical protein